MKPSLSFGIHVGPLIDQEFHDSEMSHLAAAMVRGAAFGLGIRVEALV